MVHALTINPSPLFQIRLEQDVLTMHGSQTESVGCFLRGQLILALTESIKVREIRLTFKGKSKISWTDDESLYHHSERRTLFQHDWIFLPAEKNYHVLKPDNYHWDFELVLPGTLPETINVCEKNNYINYTLKAIAERHTFASNLQTRRTVKIQRCLLPTSLDLIQSVVVSNVWVDKVNYELSMESKIFSLGDKIPVSIKLTPLQESLKFNHTTFALKEYVTYQIGSYSKTESKTTTMFKDVDFIRISEDESGLEVWTKRFDLPIPSSSDHCLFDSDSFLKINHKLKVSIVFQITKPSGEKCLAELRANMPVVITCVSPSSEIMSLPAYDNHNIIDSSNDSNNNIIIDSDSSNDSNSNSVVDNNSSNSIIVINGDHNNDDKNSDNNNNSSSTSSSSPTSNDDNDNLSTPLSSHSFVASPNSNSSFVNTSSEGSQEIHHNTIDNLFGHEILNRLPSYQSIANEIPPPLTDSILPPGYMDSC